MSGDWSLWNYRATPDPRSDHEVGVVDGDTLDLMLDLGLSTHATVRVRLAGVDTAEKYGQPAESEEYREAVKQSAFVRNWLIEAARHPDAMADWPLTVATTKDETGKYGRLLATVNDADGVNLNASITTEYPATEVA